MNEKQILALRALNRALTSAEDAGVIASLSPQESKQSYDRFQNALRALSSATLSPPELATWTVLHGPGHHYVCEAEDIHHAIELCEYAHPGDNIVTAFAGTNESQIEVVHWDATRYGREGSADDGSTPFVIGAWDRRAASGQFDVTMAPADGDFDDLLYTLFEVNRLPGSKDDTQCVHIHFDSENLAFSVFKQRGSYIVRPENGVTVHNTTLPTGEHALVVASRRN